MTKEVACQQKGAPMIIDLNQTWFVKWPILPSTQKATLACISTLRHELSEPFGQNAKVSLKVGGLKD